MQNDLSNGEKSFFVYSKDDQLTFEYSFGHKGHGPEDFLMPTMINNSPKNEFYIYEFINKSIRHYSLTESEAVLVEQLPMYPQDFPIQELSFFNDSILVYRVSSNESVTLYSYNINSGLNIDTLQFDTPIRGILGENYNSYLDVFKFSLNGSKIVCVFEFLNQIKVGEISNEGKFIMNGGVKINTGHHINTALYENICYYYFPNTTSNYLFLPYYGKVFKNMQPFPFNLGRRDFNLDIEIYNWDKEPIARLTLENELIRVFVDEEKKRLYTWDFMKDLDYMLYYDLSWL